MHFRSTPTHRGSLAELAKKSGVTARAPRVYCEKRAIHMTHETSLKWFTENTLLSFTLQERPTILHYE